MKRIAVLVALCALTQTASAEVGDCMAITDAAAQLACLNHETPPAVRRPAPAISRPAAAAKPAAASTDGSNYVDRIGAEDAIVSAKMRSLCRGC